ncbi:hypothetical protein A6B43_01825 [Vespertiliibacter pulmonis]|uniref:Ribosomal-protein-serine acetyltransferase n=1 Tax=Vespertiliibacter pulmonis TaxID=1443036 RepID=A0A3N4VYV9_9PAST|nr:GNAT family N-acetyltransferase [Vespertiliibacter pulmonis]QLB20368.1 hypothetical protein A6B43_01825 [Vespertiliibacter pulmonis]RPE86355.1 ribosomal-protein-serine acetyltransferase [Vespertiliibacter pulmonis]
MVEFSEIINITPHIRLEKIAPRHSEDIFTQIDRHRDYLSNYAQWPRFTKVLNDSLQFIQLCEQEAKQGESFVWAICVQDENSKIFHAVGTISFNKPIDWQHRRAEIGYWISPEMQGRGIITQSVNAITKTTYHAFSEYILRCAVHNERSNKVAQRCGFTYIDTLKNGEKIGDHEYNVNIYRKSS